MNRRNAHKLDIWGRQGQQKSCTVQIARDSCVLAGPTRDIGSNLAHRRHQRHSRPRACVICLSLKTGWTKTCCGQCLPSCAQAHSCCRSLELRLAAHIQAGPESLLGCSRVMPTKAMSAAWTDNFRCRWTCSAAEKVIPLQGHTISHAMADCAYGKRKTFKFVLLSTDHEVLITPVFPVWQDLSYMQVAYVW